MLYENRADTSVYLHVCNKIKPKTKYEYSVWW